MRRAPWRRRDRRGREPSAGLDASASATRFAAGGTGRSQTSPADGGPRRLSEEPRGPPAGRLVSGSSGAGLGPGRAGCRRDVELQLAHLVADRAGRPARGRSHAARRRAGAGIVLGRRIGRSRRCASRGVPSARERRRALRPTVRVGSDAHTRAPRRWRHPGPGLLPASHRSGSCSAERALALVAMYVIDLAGTLVDGLSRSAWSAHSSTTERPSRRTSLWSTPG